MSEGGELESIGEKSLECVLEEPDREGSEPRRNNLDSQTRQMPLIVISEP